MKRQEYAEKLVHLYKDTFKKEGWPPERYYQTKPTIPWIGDHYGEHRILIYASTENLGDWVDKTEYRSAFFTEDAFNRHARFWESGEKEIGIAPFDTGGLRLVGIMCLKKLGLEIPQTEHIAHYIAVANMSKFSLLQRNGKNVDVKTKKDMKPSCNYLQIDLEILKPNLIINASGKRGKWLDKIFKEFAQGSCVISLPQYTKKQRASRHLRKKVSCCEVQEFRPALTSLIKEYSCQLKKVEKKVSNDDFVRYFCLVQQRLVHADC